MIESVKLNVRVEGDDHFFPTSSASIFWMPVAVTVVLEPATPKASAEAVEDGVVVRGGASSNFPTGEAIRMLL